MTRKHRRSLLDWLASGKPDAAGYRAIDPDRWQALRAEMDRAKPDDIADDANRFKPCRHPDQWHDWTQPKPKKDTTPK
jgi:hypothetical protein